MEKSMKIIPPEGYEVDKENSTFECIKFKPIESQLPKTWEEFCELYPIKEEEAYINNSGRVSLLNNGRRDFLTNKNLLPSEKYAKAMLALCQLIQLRDYYNGSWWPDWSDDKSKKYCIIISHNNIAIGFYWTDQKILAFKTPELRSEFLKNFKDLIETAKPLL